MKKLLTIITLALAVVTAKAQTPTDPISGFWEGMQNSGLLSATNYSIAPYFTYAPQAPKGSKCGGGLITSTIMLGQGLAWITSANSLL